VVRDALEQTGLPVWVVDDGSSDTTAQEAKAAGARVLSHPTNRGVGAAIRTGLVTARASGFEIAVIVSGSGKTPACEVPKLLATLADCHADLVQGSRYAPGGRALRLPTHRRLGTRVPALLFTLLRGRRVTDSTSGFRAIRLSPLNDPSIDLGQRWLDTYELEPYLLWTAMRRHRVVEVGVTIAYPHNSAAAYTKMVTVVDWWRICRPLFLLALGLRR